jgi:hypothetical protein
MQLWREVHAKLLPLMALVVGHIEVEGARQQRVLAAAAQQAGSRSAGHGVGSGGGKEGGMGIWGEGDGVQQVAMACRLLYFYCLSAPPGALAAAPRMKEAIMSGGLFRALTLLFLHMGTRPEAEPLRCALLLCCAASPDLAAWAAAVPGFGTAWQAKPFAVGEHVQMGEGMWL